MSALPFTKTSPDAAGEAAGLRWLAAAMPSGGANVVAVQSVSRNTLVLDTVETTPASAQKARRFGAALAHTHAAGAPWWGCPPDGWPGRPSVGNSATPLASAPEQAPTNWGEFYATYRIEAFTRRLVDKGTLTADQAQPLIRLAERLGAGELDHEQPRLVARAGHQVSRVHGDMWAGNVLYDDGPSGASLIDPMAHGGHAETDLGTLSVFGFPYLADVYAGYDEESPLAAGWQERVELHQLGIVVMHAVLFGGPYITESLALASRYA